MTGRAWKFGDNIDTDLIIPARRLVTSNPEELAKYCMEDADPTFAELVRPGDIIVAGDNFGCGSSREHAPIAIRAAGVACVIAKNFARIFYRNAFNIGLPIMECPDADRIQTGDRLKVDMGRGEIFHLETGAIFKSSPIPPFMQELVADGGLIDHIAKTLKKSPAAGAGARTRKK
ncbi:MAG TPA: 3-isopropylmalate dehydratase small subunit [Syntrophales bacterium]|nr:3-isopropylmalate dehydratase small subunit [Syntrophales bacterium]